MSKHGNKVRKFEEERGITMRDFKTPGGTASFEAGAELEGRRQKAIKKLRKALV